MLAGVDGEADPIERIGRLGARLILQALRDELTEFLGRARYERAEEPVSHRNGYEPRLVDRGPGRARAPARAQGFQCRILGRCVAHVRAGVADHLLVLRGSRCATSRPRFEETFDEPVIGKSTVVRVCQDTSERYRRWGERRLEQHDLVYLFCRALYLKLRPDDEPAEACWSRGASDLMA